MENETILKGHTSPETAYVVDDYPYGFKLRCKIRYWLEYKRSQGYRLVSQTTNPKKTGEVWNKPKASTYRDLAFMFLAPENEKGIREVSWHGWSFYRPEEFEPFVTKGYEALREDLIAMQIITAYRAAVERRNNARQGVTA